VSIAGISARLGNIAFGIQSVKGTPAASPTVKAFFAGAPSLQPYITDDRYNLTDGVRDPGDPYVSQIGVKGQVPLYAHPDLMALLWHLTLGANADAGAGDPWTHTATPANALPYFTIWRSVGGVIFEKYTDCKINSMTIDGQAGKPLQVTLDIVGITSTFLASEVVANPDTLAPFLYMHGAGALKVDTVAYPIHVLNVQVNNNLNPFQADGFGIDNIDEQAREITGSYTIRFSGAIAQPLDYRAYFYGSDGGTAQTTGFSTHALDFKFTHTIANRDMDLLIPVAKWADVPVQPDPGGNTLEVQCAFEAQRNFSGGVEQNIMTVITRDGTATA
jgi:hypothetical protein